MTRVSINLQRDMFADGLPGSRRAEATPSFGRLCPAMTSWCQRSDAVRITNDCVASVAIAGPVNRSLTIPICGSSEKLIATTACGLTKWIRIKVMSVSPRTVVDIDVLALGASIMTRIQTPWPVAAAIRVDVAIALP